MYNIVALYENDPVKEQQQFPSVFSVPSVVNHQSS